MKRRQLIAAIFGTMALSQLPRALAAPAPKYPRGQTPSFVHLDDAPFQVSLDLGEGDFTASYWLAPDLDDLPWNFVTLVQEDQRLYGYVNGVQAAEGESALQDYRFYGAAVLGQVASSGTRTRECLDAFIQLMKQHNVAGVRNITVHRSVTTIDGFDVVEHHDLSLLPRSETSVKLLQQDARFMEITHTPILGLIRA